MAWSDSEIEETVKAYFAMLRKERWSESYTKAQYRRYVQTRTGRSEGAVEYKFQNVSAVLEDHGLPWIAGYKPATNYQKALEPVVLTWADSHGLGATSSTVTSASTDETTVDRRSAVILRAGISDKPAGSRSPSSSSTSTTVYARDPEVRAWVLQEAAGICELCEGKAPFVRTDGTPYLETHHVVSLSAGGPDTPDNVVALCANCHRRVHHGEDAAEATDMLYETVNRLKRL